MKKFMTCLAMSVCLMSGSVFAQNSAVVYFTLMHNRLGVDDPITAVGNTQRVAEEIVRQTGADLFELKTVKAYPARYNQTTEQAKNELENDEQIKLKSIPDIETYDTIYLCFPNWWGTYPQAIKTFLLSQNFNNKTIYSFVTNEGSGFGRSTRDLKNLLQNTTIVPLLEIRGSDCDEADLGERIQEALDKASK